MPEISFQHQKVSRDLLELQDTQQGQDVNHRAAGQRSLQSFAVPACQLCI